MKLWSSNLKILQLTKKKEKKETRLRISTALISSCHSDCISAQKLAKKFKSGHKIARIATLNSSVFSAKKSKSAALHGAWLTEARPSLPLLAVHVSHAPRDFGHFALIRPKVDQGQYITGSLSFDRHKYF